jgi:hypothetical protein
MPDGLPVGTGAGAGAAIGTIVPGLGTVIGGAIGSIVDIISSLAHIGHATEHLDWDTSNAAANKISIAVSAGVRDKFPGQYDAIGLEYRKRMLAFLNATNRWGSGFPQDKEMTIVSMENRAPSEDKVYFTTWLWAMWALQNTDKNRPDDFQGVAASDLNETLGRAVTAVTGTTVNVGVGGFSTGTGKPGAAATSGAMFAGISPLIALAIGGVIIFAMMKK